MVFRDFFYGTRWPVSARASDLQQVPKLAQCISSMQFRIVTKAGSADLFVSVRQNFLLPCTPKLQSQWLAWVVEVQRKPHQLLACDHVEDWHRKRDGFGGWQVDETISYLSYSFNDVIRAVTCQSSFLDGRSIVMFLTLDPTFWPSLYSTSRWNLWYVQSW